MRYMKVICSAFGTWQRARSPLPRPGAVIIAPPPGPAARRRRDGDSGATLRARRARLACGIRQFTAVTVVRYNFIVDLDSHLAAGVGPRVHPRDAAPGWLSASSHRVCAARCAPALRGRRAPRAAWPSAADWGRCPVPTDRVRRRRRWACSVPSSSSCTSGAMPPDLATAPGWPGPRRDATGPTPPMRAVKVLPYCLPLFQCTSSVRLCITNRSRRRRTSDHAPR